MSKYRLRYLDWAENAKAVNVTHYHDRDMRDKLRDEFHEWVSEYQFGVIIGRYPTPEMEEWLDVDCASDFRVNGWLGQGDLIKFEREDDATLFAIKFGYRIIA